MGQSSWNNLVNYIVLDHVNVYIVIYIQAEERLTLKKAFHFLSSTITCGGLLSLHSVSNLKAVTFCTIGQHLHAGRGSCICMYFIKTWHPDVGTEELSGYRVSARWNKCKGALIVSLWNEENKWYNLMSHDAGIFCKISFLSQRLRSSSEDIKSEWNIRFVYSSLQFA